MRRLFFTIISIALAAPAWGADFKAPIRQYDGTPVPVSPTDPSPLTLGKIIEDAMIANNLPTDTANAAEKGDRFRLGLKVHEGKDLSAADVVMVKKVVGLAYGPLIIGRVDEMLDPASVPK